MRRFVHPILVTLIFSLIGLVLILNPLRDWLMWRGLENDGQIVPAALVEVAEERGTLGNTLFKIRYEYQIGLSAYSAEQTISSELYEDVRLKSAVSVLVQPDSPEVSRVVGSKPNHSVGVIRGVLAILLGVVIWLLWELQQALNRHTLNPYAHVEP